MTLDQLCELFAVSHKDFAHNPAPLAKSEQKSYYRIGNLDKDCEFVRNFNTCHSPAMAYSNLADIEVNGKQYISRIPLYIMMKVRGNQSATQKQDDAQAFEVRESLTAYAIEFLKWLLHYKRKHPNDDSLRGIVLEDIIIGGIPVRYNGWWILGIMFTKVNHLTECITAENYLDIDPATLQPRN